jgi:hypothetical protein
MTYENEEELDKARIATEQAKAHMLECIGDAVRGVGATVGLYIALQALDVFIKL